MAHLGAAAIEEGKENRQIKERLTESCGEDYINQPITEKTLEDLASGAKDYAFATKANLHDNLEIDKWAAI